MEIFFLKHVKKKKKNLGSSLAFSKKLRNALFASISFLITSSPSLYSLIKIVYNFKAGAWRVNTFGEEGGGEEGGEEEGGGEGRIFFGGGGGKEEKKS